MKALISSSLGISFAATLACAPSEFDFVLRFFLGGEFASSLSLGPLGSSVLEAVFVGSSGASAATYGSFNRRFRAVVDIRAEASTSSVGLSVDDMITLADSFG